MNASDELESISQLMLSASSIDCGGELMSSTSRMFGCLVLDRTPELELATQTRELLALAVNL